MKPKYVKFLPIVTAEFRDDGRVVFTMDWSDSAHVAYDEDYQELPGNVLQAASFVADEFIDSLPENIVWHPARHWEDYLQLAEPITGTPGPAA